MYTYVHVVAQCLSSLSTVVWIYNMHTNIQNLHETSTVIVPNVFLC